MNNMSSAFPVASSTPKDPAIRQGDDIPEIVTSSLGFKTLPLQGDKKVKVLKHPWPQDALPPSYASLLAVASAHALFVAAGPDGLVVGKMDDIRAALYKVEGDDIRDYEPLNIIPHNRPAQVAFAADESCIVVAEENVADFVAYGTSTLLNPSPPVALRLSTNAPVKIIVPNPDPAQAHLFAVLNTSGQLLLADLRSGELISGGNGPVLAENVICVTWSAKGKQLIAGKADATAIQLKPDGAVVATIGKPSSVPQSCHLAQVVWIENDVFLFIYTSSSASDDLASLAPEYYIVKTDKTRSDFLFNKFSVDLFWPAVARLPAHFHVSRLRKYAPNLDELLIIGSSISPEIKTITKSKAPLSSEVDEPDLYTLTTCEDDGRTAATPMGQDGTTETSPIGLALDLSDKDIVISPLRSDPEIKDSAVPLPQLVALNNEGLISVWAVIYADAVKSRQPYPGFEEIARIRANIDSPTEVHIEATLTSNAPQPPNTYGHASASASPTPGFPFANASNFGMQASQQQPSGFGQTSSLGTSTFGQPTPIGGGGEAKPSWTNTGFSTGANSADSPFGRAPAFGSTPLLGSSSKPAFGQSSTPIATPGFGQPAFGQAGLGNQAKSASPFMSTPNPSSGGGFSSFASGAKGFGAANKDSTTSGFGKFGNGGGFASGANPNPFAAPSSNTASPFGQISSNSPFAKSSIFGAPTSGQNKPQVAESPFKLESSFKQDHTSKDDDDAKGDSGTGFGFGGLGGMLGNTNSNPLQSPSKELEMEDDSESAEEVENFEKSQTTPTSTISQAKNVTTPHVNSIFKNNTSTTPLTQPQYSVGGGWNFGGVPSTTPKDAPAPVPTKFAAKTSTDETTAAVQTSEPYKPLKFSPPTSQRSDSKRVKSLSDQEDGEEEEEEEEEEGENDADADADADDTATGGPAAPLPPDPFSKPEYQAGDTSVSSSTSKASNAPENAPLPPDFTPANRSATKGLQKQDSDIPSEVLSSDGFEDGSGEDVTGDVSPVEGRESDQDEQIEHADTSPGSSSGHTSDRSHAASPPSEHFFKIPKANQSKPPRLFGELSGSGPILPPPQAKPEEGQRSPSPMRKPPRHGMLSRSPERSVSAPAHPRSMIQKAKSDYQSSQLAVQAARERQAEIDHERALLDAARLAREQAKAAEIDSLVDDEDAILQQELAKPTEPSEILDQFITIQPGRVLQGLEQGHLDIPSQIERLYQDINSMVVTLGINSKSLSSYMMYQVGHPSNDGLSSILESDTPMDILNDEWYLGDIGVLPKGILTIDAQLAGLEVKDIFQKLEDCRDLLTKEVTDLRTRITTLRRSTQARSRPESNIQAPLSAEQAAIQQDLRKSSASVLNDLTHVEDSLVELKAKLADLTPSSSDGDRQAMFGPGVSSGKKPSVAAVMSTVMKMTSMAEKKSADVDVLEAQMKKLSLPVISEAQPLTPERGTSTKGPFTPGSATSSVYLTPGARTPRSVRATPSKADLIVVSVDDRQKLQLKAKKRQDIASTLKKVLQEKHSK